MSLVFEYNLYNDSQKKCEGDDMNQTFKIENLAIKRFGSPQTEYFMFSRPIGIEDREQFLLNEIIQMNAGGTFIMDFSHIKLVDVSYIDEILLNTLINCREGVLGERYVAVTNINEGVKNNLEAAISLRSEKYKVFIPVVNFVDNKKVVIGNLEKTLSDTYEIISNRGSVTAKDLVNSSDIDQRNANTRLKRLYDYRLVKREKTNEDGVWQYSLL